MATKLDLVGLGTPPLVADLMGDTPTLFTASGSTAGSAAKIPGTQYTTVVNTGTSAVKLPQVGGDGIGYGGVLGAEYKIVNLTSADISVFISNNDKGSAVTFFASAISVVGTTGVTIVPGRVFVTYPLTISTWAVLGSANSS
jgi:hypothetical protein